VGAAVSQLTFDVLGEGGGDELEAPKSLKSEDIERTWYKGRVLSHSSMYLYKQCPQKWKFKYVDKIPEKPRSYFSFGKSVHNGLEFLFTKLTEMPTLEAVLAHYKTGWLREGYETHQQEKWFFQEGERILKGFYAKHHADFKNVLQVEFRFTIGIEGVPVTGFIDRIDNTPSGGIAIIDYKTGKPFDKARVRNDPQLTLYQMATRELLGKNVETVSLYHLNSFTALTVPAHSKTLEENLRQSVVETAHGIQDAKFEPKPDAKGHCQWCDYVQVCPAFAGKKLPMATAEAYQEPIPHVADKFGQLNKKIKEMEAERDQLGDTLLSHFRHTATEDAQGKHFSVKVIHGENGEEPKLESKPLK
jgi:RecB family exonuclease